MEANMAADKKMFLAYMLLAMVANKVAGMVPLIHILQESIFLCL